MTMDKHSSRQDRALWQRARPALASASSGAPDETEAASLLAAYLDGRLDEAGRDRVEAWLAGDAEALDSLIAARAALDAELAVPPGLIARAQGLVREPRKVTGPVVARGGVLARLRGLLIPDAPLWQPVGLAAALLLACVVGFQLGEAGYSDLLADREMTTADSGFDLAAAGDDFF
ncbi:MAG: anti-sigma factor family protein [Kiloniellales bacterium]